MYVCGLNHFIIVMRILLPFLAFHLLIVFSSYGVEVKTNSPDKKNTVIVKLNPEKDNALFYSIVIQGNIIIADSPLGLAFENQVPLHTKLQIVSSPQKEVNEPWKPVYGEKNQYSNHYNETTLNLKEINTPFRNFSVVVRAYNEGIAFRYQVQTEQPVTITHELTGFQF